MKWPLVHFPFIISVTYSVETSSHVPYMTLYFIPLSGWTMKGFLTSSEGRSAPDREGKVNLMNGLADGKRQRGGQGLEGGYVNILTLCVVYKALVLLVEMHYIFFKKVV